VYNPDGVMPEVSKDAKVYNYLLEQHIASVEIKWCEIADGVYEKALILTFSEGNKARIDIKDYDIRVMG
jgi:hypothetical protein